MTRDRRAYIVRETAISAAINIAMSMFFFLALFGGRPQVPIWGGGLVLDCLPQGFVVGLMSVLPSGFITRSRIARGRMRGRQAPMRTILVHAALTALAAMLALTGVAVALAWLSGATMIALFPAILVKALAGGAVTIIATPLALRALS